MATTNTGNEGAVNVLGTSAAVDDKTVEVTLSVFLSARNAKSLGLAEKEFKPGEKVKLTRENAQSLIGQAGVKGVKPNDNDAIRKLLGLK